MDFHLSTATRTLWQEARNQPQAGQIGVAHAIVNRLRSGRWGQTLAEVCLSEYKGIFQFSGWMRNDSNRVPAMRLAESDPLFLALAAMVQGALAPGAVDPTGGATHYYNPKACAEPDWVMGDPARGIKAATFTVQIGAHLFYKDVP